MPSVEFTLLTSAKLLTIMVNGEKAGLSYGDEFVISHTTSEQAITIEVHQAGKTLLKQEIPVIPGWVSLLPLIAITLAFLLRSVVPALFMGLLVGAWRQWAHIQRPNQEY